MNRLRWIITICLFVLTQVSDANFLFSPINVSHGLSDNQIRYILQLPDGRMVFTTSGNLNIYDGTNIKYIHRTTENIYQLKNYKGHYRIYQSEDSLLWIKDTHKLMCVNLHKEQYIPNLKQYFSSRGIDQHVTDFFVDSEHRWWILTTEGLFNPDTQILLDISTDRSNLQDLTSDKNHLYLFYSNGNVACHDLQTQNKSYSVSAYSKQESKLYNNTSLIVKGDNGIYQLRNGSNGVFLFFDTINRSWKKLLETNYTLNTLIVPNDNTAYITCKNGIWIINLRNGHKQFYPELKTVDGQTIQTEISTAFQDKQGGLWLGTFNQGLLYYHPHRYRFSYIGRSYFQNRPFGDILIENFAEDKHGNIYIKSQSKVYKLDSMALHNHEIKRVDLSSLSDEVHRKLFLTKEYASSNNDFTCSLKDSRAWRWFGTKDGLKLYKPGSQVEKTYYTEDGLTNNFIHGLIEDSNHQLWITTSYGISKILPDSISNKVQFLNFNPLDGTLDGEYVNGAVYEASDGTLYFGGVNGFNILKPDQIIPVEPLPFKPIFTKLYVKGEKVEIGNLYDGRIILTKAAPYTTALDLSYKQNFIKLEFSALNYLNSHQTRYRYQLMGLGNEWVESYADNNQIGKKGKLQVSYTNLPPGKYLFKVMASDNTNQWDKKPTLLKITIHAPWWKTRTAYVLYLIFVLILVSSGIFLYHYLSRKKLQRQHREEILLLRIRNLIEQYNKLEAEKNTSWEESDAESNISDTNNELNSIDSEFLSKAIALVEENLNTPDYSVEQLSRDLCMDRTGLYRKLISLLDKSPSLFIRGIRLQKAAQLLLEEKFNITEIAEKVGFSSASYLSRCFQETYGCRPSEYAQKTRKST